MERCQDAQNVKAALLAIQRLQAEISAWIPVMLTAELAGRPVMLDNTAPSELLNLVPSLKLLALGITGPAATLVTALPELLRSSGGWIVALPDSFGFQTPGWFETPESLREQMKLLCTDERIRIVGVGLGARADFIQAVATS